MLRVKNEGQLIETKTKHRLVYEFWLLISHDLDVRQKPLYYTTIKLSARKTDNALATLRLAVFQHYPTFGSTLILNCKFHAIDLKPVHIVLPPIAV